MQHMPASAPVEAQAPTARFDPVLRQLWSDTSLDDAPSTLVDLASGVTTVPAAGTRGDRYDEMSDEQIVNLPAPGFQVHLPDNDADLDISEQ